MTGGRGTDVRWNLPVTPIYDLAIKGSDLVAATHGRSFWVLDDLTPLREQNAEATGGGVHLFPPRSTVRPWQNWSVDLFRGPGKAHKNYMMALGTGLTFYEDRTPEGERVRTFLDAGENPPAGAIVYYMLGEASAGPISMTFLDARGRRSARSRRGRRRRPPPTAPRALRSPARPPRSHRHRRRTSVTSPPGPGSTASCGTSAIPARRRFRATSRPKRRSPDRSRHPDATRSVSRWATGRGLSRSR